MPRVPVLNPTCTCPKSFFCFCFSFFFVLWDIDYLSFRSLFIRYLNPRMISSSVRWRSSGSSAGFSAFRSVSAVFLDIHGSKAILIVVLKNLFAVLTFTAIILLDYFTVTYRTFLQVHGCSPFYTYICLVPSSSRSISVTPVRSARASAAGVK